jgi:hypothetical protein
MTKGKDNKVVTEGGNNGRREAISYWHFLIVPNG